MKIRKIALWCAMFALAIIAIVSLAAGVKNGMTTLKDFQWLPAKILASGQNPYLYSLKHLSWQGWPKIDANQVPSCLLLLYPWTLMSYAMANSFWALCNLAFTAIFCLYVFKLFFASDAPLKVKGNYWIVVLLLLSGMPLRMVIGNGQHLLFSLAFFAPALYYAMKKRENLAGVLLALCFFKYTSVAPMCLVFVAIGAWRTIMIGAGLHVAATVGCGIYLHENPITLVLQSFEVGAMLLTGAGCTDIVSALTRCGCDWASKLSLPMYAIFGVMSLLVAMRNCIGNVLLKLSTLTMLAIVMFYHRTYDLVALIIPCIWAMDVLLTNGKRNLARITALVILVNVAYVFYGLKILDVLGVCSLIYQLSVPIMEHVVALFLFVLCVQRPCQELESSH